MDEAEGPKPFRPDLSDTKPISPTPNEPALDTKPDSSATPRPDELATLGSDLARVMQDQGYHPVVLFGTNNSGKTSLLMSLFSVIISQPSLETGLSLCDPLLGSKSDIGRALHKEAAHTFTIKTQAFLANQKIPRTSTAFPFFIPVEFRPPDGKPSVRFAFMESNGEWYRPNISDGTKLADLEELYPKLRSEIERFISSFQNGITFIYTAPTTQGEVYAATENTFDANELHYASLAIKGVLDSYDRIRANARSSDKHLMLITKWDAISVRQANRAEGISEDPALVAEFCRKKYTQALSAFQGLNLSSDQRKINAYCAGMINQDGALPLKSDDYARGVIDSYPVKLWTWLYKNALEAQGDAIVSPFREPPSPPYLAKLFTTLLNKISGA